MIKKELRFSSVIDTSEFDKAVKDMQQKLKSVYESGDRSRSQIEIRQIANRAGLAPAPTRAEQAKSDADDRRTKKELDTFIKDQLKTQESLGKIIAKQLQDKKELVKLAKQDYDSALKLMDVEKSMATNREKMKLSEEATRQALQARTAPGFGGEGGFGGAFARGEAAYRGARAGGGAGFMGGLGAGIKGFGRGIAGMGIQGIAGIAHLAGSGALGIGGILESANLAERQILAAQGTARQTFGRPATEVLSGRGFEQAFYAPEMAKATEGASEEIKKTKRNDLLKLAGAAVLTVAGAVTAATGVGAGVGLPLVAAGASLYGAKHVGSSILDRITGTYQAGLEQKQAESFQQRVNAYQQLDPVRRAVMDRYQREVMPNLSTQRATGLDDQELREQLLQGTQAGFGIGTTRQAMQNILSSGGSTRTARESSTFVNQLQRNLGLTNATQAMGRISALTGESKQAETSMLKVLSEAFSLGLDKSKFAEEQRRFTGTVTEIISRSGATSVGAQGMITEEFTRFLGKTPGMTQLEGARTAYEAVQAMTAETGGPRGAFQAAAIQSDPRLKKLHPSFKNMLAQMSEEQVLAGGPIVEGMAASLDMDANEFKKLVVGKVKDQSLIPTAAGERAKTEMQQLKATGKEGTKEFQVAQAMVLAQTGIVTPEVAKMKPEAQTALARRMAELAEISTPEEKAQAEAMQKLPPEQRALTPEEEVKKRIATAPKRDAEEHVAALAASDEAYLNSVTVFRGQIDATHNSMKEFSETIVKITAGLGKIDPNDYEAQAVALKRLAEVYKQMGVGVEANAPEGRSLVTQPKGAAPSGK